MKQTKSRKAEGKDLTSGSDKEDAPHSLRTWPFSVSLHRFPPEPRQIALTLLFPVGHFRPRSVDCLISSLPGKSPQAGVREKPDHLAALGNLLLPSCTDLSDLRREP